MPASDPLAATTIMPLMRYRDVGVAMEWLCAAFGFETHFSARAPDGSVFYAELRLGDGIIMLGSVGEPSLDAVMAHPDESGASQTQSCYVVIDDPTAHLERATRAGAEIVLDNTTDANGGRGYVCRDLEGHAWNFGTYNPWTAQASKPTRAAKPATSSATSSVWLRTAMAATLVGSILSGWWLYAPLRDAAVRLDIRGALLGERPAPPPQGGWATGTIQRDQATVAATRAELSRAEAAMAALKADLERERAAKEAAAQAASSAKAEADKANRIAAAAKQLESELARTQEEQQRISHSARESSDALAREREEKQSALDAARAAKAEIDRERFAKEQALKAAGEAEGKVATAAAAQEELARKTEELRQENAALKAANDDDAAEPTPPAAEPPKVAPKPAAKREKPLKRIKAVSAARKKAKSPQPTQDWPFSSW